MYTTCLGNALYNIHKFEGYDTVGINHLGDYGTQFGKLIYAYGQWGDEAALEADPIRELTRIYVKFHREAEADPTLNEAGRNHFKKLEAGEPYETGLWTRFRDLSLKDFNKVYAMLNINFDSIKGEAFYSDQMADVVESIRGKGLLTESMTLRWSCWTIQYAAGDDPEIRRVDDLCHQGHHSSHLPEKHL